MTEPAAAEAILADLNDQQRQAAAHGTGPLLVIAGAGTGKTATLVHRVAWLIAGGVDPSRILLLTFTRRAAAEMLRRADGVLRRLQKLQGAETARRTPVGRVWGGTFHAIATRLLRRYGKAIGLSEQFTIHDRSDSEDLLNVVRSELGLAKTDRRFPKKGTCMAIYSRCVSARQKLPEALKQHFPWCAEWQDELKRLFDAYVDRKEAAGVLDYDDLLLFWHALLADEQSGPVIRGMFDCVLVDEYQDTNRLQAEIIYRLSPEGRGLTVVGDDAQSIYSFRAATVRNIRELPERYPDTSVVALEQNYRSTQPILEATNAVIAQATDRFAKNLWSQRAQGQRPLLVSCEDEDEQSLYLIERMLEHREAGIDLRRQAVLFRTSHHSMSLEAELSRRNIPFHKYGGLKFVETAHIKDLMAFLRLAENPLDVVAAMRLLPRLPGIGAKRAENLVHLLADAAGDFAVWTKWKPPQAAVEQWPAFCRLMQSLAGSRRPLPEQINQVRNFFVPLVPEIYDNAQPRLRDLEQLEQISSRYADRATMLAELTLDPPNSTQDLAGPPLLDDDYLVLSTIHSAKGLEWDVVYVIHAADGNIPSDMATGSPEEIEEELRLFYVAMTRAKTWLYVTCPLRYYHYRRGSSDRHGYAQRTRFLPKPLLDRFEMHTPQGPVGSDAPGQIRTDLTSESVRRDTKRLW
jgi:DNA helicase-2/ATP-dependent DNA helicase PcrA